MQASFRSLSEKSRRDAMFIEKVPGRHCKAIYARKVFGCAPKGASDLNPVRCSINISPLRGFSVLWAFMGLFGGGADQFRRGWSRWSNASSELKALGYQKPPGALTPQPESESTPLTESRTTTALPLRLDLSGPPSITESTTGSALLACCHLCHR